MNKDLLWALFDHLSEYFGRRLKSIKSKTVAGGAVSWASVVYELTWAGDVLKSVKHIPSAIQVDVPASAVTKQMQLQSPWLDHQAAFLLPSMQPTKVSAFFGKKMGPNSLENLGRSVILRRIMDEVTAQHEEKQRQNSATAASSSSGKASEVKKVAEQLQKEKQGVQLKRMRELREKAKETMNQKKRKATFTL